MNNKFNWKLYFTLLLASIVSIIAVLPYGFTLGREIIKQSQLSLPVLIIISIIQSSVLFAVVLFLGIKLSKKVGLGAPIIEGYISGEKNY